MLHRRLVAPVFALASVLSGVLAQNETQQQNATFLESFIGFLQDSGYSNFTSALLQANDTQTGKTLLAELSSGGNWTLFAPSDAAFSNTSVVNASVEDLADVLSYHVLRGDLSNTTAASGSQASVLQTGGSDPNITGATILSDIYPNITVARTQLNSSEWVDLEGNKSQVLAWTRNSSDTPVYIINQDLEGGHNVTIKNTTRFDNIIINPIDSILIPPRGFISVLNSTNLTVLGAILSQVPSPPGFFNGSAANVSSGANASLAQAINDLGSNRTTEPGGYTLFAPTDFAFSQSASVLQGLVTNLSAISSVFGNHLINGTTVYSPELFGPIANETTYVSAAGEPFVFFTNDTGNFVGIEGNTSAQAQIVRSDVLTKNGVIHIINSVLVETSNNSAAASSAYVSATSEAASSTVETLPIGFVTTTSSSGSVTSSTSGTGSATTSSASATVQARANSAKIRLFKRVNFD
ncbi:hypothetical protein AX16_009478 [Volvariella volvacea WC 439]|nr:hypothetical protein AX16_009478 [Volvariella volvacea WC 439]